MENSKIYVGLDVGTTSIKVIVAESMNKQLNVIGVGSARSNGLSRGTIVDIDQAVTAIQQAVQQAEQKANIEIKRVVAGIPANLLQIEECQGMIAVADQSKEITSQDVQNVASAALVRNLPPEREILTVLPTEFTVDGFDEIKDPRGMMGVRLEMSGVLFTAPKTMIHNLKKCIEKAGLELSQLVVNPLALGKLALSDGEQDFGSIIIDLGGGQSTAAVIHDHQLKFSVIDQEGGDHITKDISVVLNTSIENAEKAKRDYGNADSLAASEEEEIPIEVVGQSVPVQVTEKKLAEIIEARLMQVFDRLKTSLDKVDAFDLPGGVIMTGGVTALPGIVDLAKEIFDCPVKLYIPDQMGLRHPSFAQGLGLINYIANLSEVDWLVQSALGNVEQPTTETQHSTQMGKTQTTVEEVPVKKIKKQSKNGFESLKNFFSNFFE
ncbi:cell division protein FtsA [Latilactobacillus fuchuensis]|uniref:Cell division protein FtsA n=1 Tax=Latilactobacillus fuchuensis TaxID=164393 RepID=A0A2N9DUS6_9LACO|nr:cell division protein FtsA [Latilactobacillus fuchuensis]SPC37964.1 Cell division protein FtsA [Latilactobacillus fuchuensis]